MATSNPQQSGSATSVTTTGATSTAAPSLSYPYPIQFLKSVTLADVVDEMTDPTRVIDILESETIKDAINAMYRHGVSCLAVYRMTLEKKREYYAFLTMSDIASFVLFKPETEHAFDEYRKKQQEETSSNIIPESKGKHVQQSSSTYGSSSSSLATQPELLCMKTQVKDVLGTMHESIEFHVFPASTDLLRVMKTFRTGVHHVFVCHPSDENCIGKEGGISFVKHQATKSPVVLSQSDLVQFLSKRISSLGEILNLNADALMLLGRQFSSTLDPNQPEHLTQSRWTGVKMKYALHQPEHISAFNCFKSMIIHRLSAIAIVDDNGQLVETLSISDFGNLSEHPFIIFFKPVIGFLHDSFEARRQPITVSKSDNLKRILEQMCESEVHRVWVVDSTTHKPLGCVSMTDIIAGMTPMETEE